MLELIDFSSHEKMCDDAAGEHYLSPVRMEMSSSAILIWQICSLNERSHSSHLLSRPPPSPLHLLVACCFCSYSWGINTGTWCNPLYEMTKLIPENILKSIACCTAAPSMRTSFSTSSCFCLKAVQAGRRRGRKER